MARAREVGEVAKAGAARTEEQDIVPVDGAVYRYHALIPAQACLRSAGDDLFQIGVRLQADWQLAWLLGIGTSELDYCRHPVVLRKVGEHGQAAAGLAHQPKRRIQARVAEALGRLQAPLAGQRIVDPSVTVAGRRGKVGPGSDGPGICRVQARSARGAHHRRSRFDLFQRIRHHATVSPQESLLLELGEGHFAAVEGGAQDDAMSGPMQGKIGAGALALLARAGGIEFAFPFIVADVAVDGVAPAVARVDHACQLAIAIDTVAPVERSLHQTVAGQVGKGEHGAPVLLVQAVGQQAIAAQATAPGQQRYVPVGPRARVPRLDEQVAKLAGRMVAPAAVIEQGDRRERMPAARAPRPVGQIDPAPAGAACGNLRFEALLHKPGTSVQRQCAAQRIEAVHGI